MQRNVERYQKTVIRSRKSKKDRQYNDQKEKGQNGKQWLIKHYIENVWLSNTNPNKIRGEFRSSGRVSTYLYCNTRTTISGIRLTDLILYLL